MKHTFLLLFCLFALSHGARSGTAPGLPEEQLTYSINWPSGLSLGESHLSAASSKSSDSPTRLHLEFQVDAAVPGFQVMDRYQSNATPDYCSVDLEKNTLHGKKKVEEKTTFDQQAGTASRETGGGGKSEVQISSCGRDALTYLYYVRHELGQGRLPAAQTVYFGAPYQVRLEFAGTQAIRMGDKNVEADRLKASAKGPSSEISFEIFFLKDTGRTPALVRVPLSLATFTMELVK